MRNAFLMVVFCLFSGTVFSAHIIGGEMYYECLGGNKYQITMKLFRDCNSQGAAFDDPASFSLFDSNNNLVQVYEKYLTSSSFIQPDLSSPCLALPPDICVQEGIYTFQIILPSNDQAYQIVYQRCCRNATIQNLSNPGDQGLTIVAEIPPADFAVCNSRPHFNNFPPPVLCAQEFLQFDHSATDPDGDSLAYSLCSPFTGGSTAIPAPSPASNPPYNPVSWGTAFGAINPLNANPGLQIDPITGLLTGTPTQLGQFVVGVCVQEWRNGHLLSVNTRDFQFNVAYCEEISTALIAQPEAEDLCDDLTFDFINLSDPGNEFEWNFGDLTTNTDVSNAYSPSYTYPDTGTYYVTLITNPGFFCSDTAVLVLPLYYETQIGVQIASFECVDGQQIFNFAANGIFDPDNAQIIWDFGPNATPQTANGLTADGVTFSTLGDQQVDVQVLDNVCEANDIITITIPSPPQVTIDPQDIFCNGLHYQFSQQNENASLFSWDFGVNGIDDDVDDGATAEYTFPNPGNYTVSLTASDPDNCPVTTTETFDIQTLLAPEIEPNPIQCLDQNSVQFHASGSYTPAAVFSWSFSDGAPATATQENPAGITYDAAGAHPVGLTISENGCTRTANGQMVIHSNPLADFIALVDSGCAPLDVSFADKSFTQSSSVAYHYDFGDGESSSSRYTTHTYMNPGTYSIHFTIENLNGCIDSDAKTVENLITVFPTPRAGFKVDPLIVSSIDPRLTITNLSQGGISCSYAFDRQIFDFCDFEYTLKNVVPQTIIQTVENEYGCRDQLKTEIKISDHLIYIPNSFTPDGDGLNDIFVPVTTGVIQLEMHIFDRWGKEIFGNEHAESGWNGSSRNENYFAEPGVYQYMIRVTDNLGWNFDYKGSIRLLR